MAQAACYQANFEFEAARNGGDTWHREYIAMQLYCIKVWYGIQVQNQNGATLVALIIFIRSHDPYILKLKPEFCAHCYCCRLSINLPISSWVIQYTIFAYVAITSGRGLALSAQLQLNSQNPCLIYRIQLAIIRNVFLSSLIFQLHDTVKKRLLVMD